MLKPSVLPWGKATRVVGLGSPDCVVFFMADDAGNVVPEHHHFSYVDPWPS
jgi:hypothetical protein